MWMWLEIVFEATGVNGSQETIGPGEGITVGRQVQKASTFLLLVRSMLLGLKGCPSPLQCAEAQMRITHNREYGFGPLINGEGELAVA